MVEDTRCAGRVDSSFILAPSPNHVLSSFTDDFQNVIQTHISNCAVLDQIKEVLNLWDTIGSSRLQSQSSTVNFCISYSLRTTSSLLNHGTLFRSTQKAKCPRIDNDPPVSNLISYKSSLSIQKMNATNSPPSTRAFLPAQYLRLHCPQLLATYHSHRFPLP